MRRGLADLAGDCGWRSRSEFKAYAKAIKQIPYLGEKQYADSVFFTYAPVCYVCQYNTILHTHVSTFVSAMDILVYLVGETQPL